MTDEELRLALANEEPDYPALAARLDALDARRLRAIAMGEDLMLATKAVYLASLLDSDAAADVVDVASRSDRELVRIASASALPNLARERRNRLAVDLIEDPNLSVRKLVLEAVDEPTPELRDKMRALGDRTQVEELRELAQKKLGPTD